MVEYNPRNAVDRALARRIEAARSRLSDAEKKTLSAEFKKQNPNMGVINRILKSK